MMLEENQDFTRSGGTRGRHPMYTWLEIDIVVKSDLYGIGWHPMHTHADT